MEQRRDKARWDEGDRQTLTKRENQAFEGGLLHLRRIITKPQHEEAAPKEKKSNPVQAKGKTEGDKDEK